jgi:hypothetical protein
MVASAKMWTENQELNDAIVFLPASDIGILCYHPNGRYLQWSSLSGGRVIRRIVCETEPLDATFCSFKDPHAVDAASSRAIAILLSENKILLNMFTGETFEVSLPSPISKIFANQHGLVLQRIPDSYVDDACLLPSFHNEERLFAPGSKGFTSNIADNGITSWIQDGLVGTTAVGAGDGLSFTQLSSSPNLYTNPYAGKQQFALSPNMSFDPVEKCLNLFCKKAPAPLFFSLSHPSAPVRPVSLQMEAAASNIDMLTITSTISTPAAKGQNMNAINNSHQYSSMKFDEEKASDLTDFIVAVDGDFVLTVARKSGTLTLWTLERIDAKVEVDDGRIEGFHATTSSFGDRGAQVFTATASSTTSSMQSSLKGTLKLNRSSSLSQTKSMGSGPGIPILFFQPKPVKDLTHTQHIE